jgi:hypothetical protein
MEGDDTILKVMPSTLSNRTNNYQNRGDNNGNQSSLSSGLGSSMPNSQSSARERNIDNSLEHATMAMQQLYVSGVIIKFYVKILLS